jgi:hypothetical protein
MAFQRDTCQLSRFIGNGNNHEAAQLWPKTNSQKFSPPPPSHLHPKAVSISGYIAVMDIEPGTQAVLYVCMAEGYDSNNSTMKSLLRSCLKVIQA